MSKVAQISVEDATQHGKKSLKELTRIIGEIQADIGTPVTNIVIMSSLQFERVNLLLRANDAFVGTMRALVGRLVAELQRTNPHHHPLFPIVDQMVDLVTGKPSEPEARANPPRIVGAP